MDTLSGTEQVNSVSSNSVSVLRVRRLVIGKTTWCTIRADMIPTAIAVMLYETGGSSRNQRINLSGAGRVCSQAIAIMYPAITVVRPSVVNGLLSSFWS